MNAVVGNILPVILVFLLGYLLKILGVLTRKDGDSLLTVFFNVSLPALIFLSVARMKFSFDLLWLPVIAALVIIITFLICHSCSRLMNLGRPSFGTFLVGSLIMNTSFIIPFLVATRGEESLAQASLFDFGNIALVFTFIYYQACKYGGKSHDSTVMIRKLVFCPPLLALIFALLLNLGGVAFPPVVAQFFKIIGYMTIPLAMLALGVYYSPKPFITFPVFLAVCIRMGVGFLLGLVFSQLFGLKGISREVVLIISSAPSGISTLVFSSMEELDNELAASIVSYSVLAGMFVVPMVLRFAAA